MEAVELIRKKKKKKEKSYPSITPLPLLSILHYGLVKAQQISTERLHEAFAVCSVTEGNVRWNYSNTAPKKLSERRVEVFIEVQLALNSSNFERFPRVI